MFKFEDYPKIKKFKCPCCGNYTLDEDPEPFFLTYEICPVCKYEVDDYIQGGGANVNSLALCQENYKKYGVSDLCSINSVRKPFPDELPENNEPALK